MLAPGWPWPLHAAHLQFAVSFALGAAAAFRIDPVRAITEGESAEVALDVLRRLELPVDDCIEQLVGGSRPGLDDLRQMNRVLLRELSAGRINRAAIFRLERARQEWRHGLTQLFRSVVGAWAVAASEEASAEAGRAFLNAAGLEVFDASPTHRYFGVLGPALSATARTAATMRLQPADIDIRVAVRGVHDMRGLSNDDLLVVDRRHRKGAVAWRSLQVIGYDREAPVMLIAADVASNAVRRLRRERRWSDANATKVTGLPFFSDAAVGS